MPRWSPRRLLGRIGGRPRPGALARSRCRVLRAPGPLAQRSRTPRWHRRDRRVAHRGAAVGWRGPRLRAEGAPSRRARGAHRGGEIRAASATLPRAPGDRKRVTPASNAASAPMSCAPASRRSPPPTGRASSPTRCRRDASARWRAPATRSTPRPRHSSATRARRSSSSSFSAYSTSWASNHRRQGIANRAGTDRGCCPRGPGTEHCSGTSSAYSGRWLPAGVSLQAAALARLAR